MIKVATTAPTPNANVENNLNVNTMDELMKEVEEKTSNLITEDPEAQDNDNDNDNPEKKEIARCTDKQLLVAAQDQLRLHNVMAVGLDLVEVGEKTPYTMNPYTSARDVPLLPENLVDIATLTDPQNLALDRGLEGKVFLCRTIVPATKVYGVETVVEDPRGKNAVRLVLYNYSTDAALERTDFDQVLPAGMFVAVKNPWMRRNMSIKEKESENETCKFELFCDNPQDVQLLSQKGLGKLFPDISWESESISTPEIENVGILDWNAAKEEIGVVLNKLGVYSHLNNRYSDALRWYELATDYIPESLEEDYVELVNNKATSYLAMGCWNRVLECAEYVIQRQPGNLDQGGVLRKVRALVGLQKHEEALEFFKGMLAKHEELAGDPHSTEFRINLENLVTQNASCTLSPENAFRLALNLESEFEEMFDQSTVPEMVGKLIELVEIEGQGRGFIATQDIEPGQLLMCSRAFSIALFCSEDQDQVVKSKVTVPRECQGEFGGDGDSLRHQHQDKKAIENGNTDRTSKKALASKNKLGLYHSYLVSEIANKIAFDPKLGLEVYKLWAGEKLQRLDEDDGRNEKVDIERISGIVEMSAFTFVSPGTWNVVGAVAGGNFDFSGLWVLPAFLNHNCTKSNAECLNYNDLMIVRAVKPVKKGRQVYLSYLSADQLVEQRMEYFKSHGFTCDCQLCLIETSESLEIRSERQTILSWLDACYDNDNELDEGQYMVNLKSDELLGIALFKVDRLVEMRKDTPYFNPCLAAPQLMGVVVALEMRQDFLRCLHLLVKLYKGVKKLGSLTKISVELVSNILKCSVSLDPPQPKLVEKWTKRLQEVLIATYGTVDVMTEMDPYLLNLLKVKAENINFFEIK